MLLNAPIHAKNIQTYAQKVIDFQSTCTRDMGFCPASGQHRLPSSRMKKLQAIA